MFFSPVGGSTANGRGTKFRKPTGQRITAGNSAGALELDESSSRHRADWTAPAGDFVLRTPNLRSWIAADATHLHYNILGNGKFIDFPLWCILCLKGIFPLKNKFFLQKGS